MSVHRPHTQTVRLTEGQHRLARHRQVEQGMSWQRLLSACVNAYAKGELDVTPSGNITVVDPLPESSTEPARPPVVSYGDDPEAIDLDDLPEADGESVLPTDLGRPYGSQAERTLGTRELAALAEEETGRRVSMPLLRELVREQYPQDDEPGPGTRYRWSPTDPEVAEIIEAIAHGALDDVRDRRMTGLVLDD